MLLSKTVTALRMLHGVLLIVVASADVKRLTQEGVECLDFFVDLYFVRTQQFTRAYNLMVTIASNLSQPAADLQATYIRLLNEGNNHGSLFQLRVLSDAVALTEDELDYEVLLRTDFYLLIVDSVSMLRRFMGDYVSRVRSWNPGALFLVLLNNEPSLQDSNETALTMEVFEELLHGYHVHNAALLLARDDHTYSFLVLDFASTSNCRSAQARPLGTCESGIPKPSAAAVSRDYWAFFEATKAINCSLLVCSSVTPPYVEANCTGGMELAILEIVATILRFNVELQCSQESRGVLTPNGTWTGLLGKLQDRSCDFIMGGFFPDNEVLDSFWTTSTYFSDQYTWYVKMAGRRASWTVLYLIFDGSTWLWSTLLMVVTWAVWHLFESVQPEPHRRPDVSLLGVNVLAMSIGIVVNERPLRPAARLLFLLIATFGLMLATVYTSQLISFFSNPGNTHQMATVEELLESELPFGGPPELRDWFQNAEDLWLYDNYNESFVYDAVHMRALIDGRVALLNNRMRMMESDISDKVFAFPAIVLACPVQMIMKAGFPFVQHFNHLLGLLRVVGIYDKIRDDFQYNYTYLNRIARMRPQFPEDDIVLTIEHMQGPFTILALGHSVALLVLLAEIACGRRRRRRPSQRTTGRVLPKTTGRKPPPRRRSSDE